MPESKTFQSTPSAWRETGELHRKRNGYDISIHSLRMEGDIWLTVALVTPRSFQSTPSAWRETDAACVVGLNKYISIHSLRMEGDRYRKDGITWQYHFNPLPPHGGRLLEIVLPVGRSIFQSTPSAWRETACVSKIGTQAHISIHSLRMEGDDL